MSNGNHVSVNLQADGSEWIDTPPPHINPSFRAGGEAFRLNHDTGAVEDLSKGATTKVASMSSGQAGGSVVATLSRIGGQDTVCLVPGDEGTRTLVSVAVREGLIREAFPGRYEDAPRSAEAVPGGPSGEGEDHDDGPVVPTSETLNAEESDAIQARIDDLPQEAYDSAVASAIGALQAGGGSAGDDGDGRGDRFSRVIQGLVSDTGMHPNEAAERVEEVRKGFQQFADRAMTEAGITEAEDLAAFYRDVQTHQGFGDALQHLIAAGDARPFKGLAREWLSRVGRRRDEDIERAATDSGTMHAKETAAASMATTVAELEASGFETSVNHKGELVVRHRGVGAQWRTLTDVLKHSGEF